jgi:hypothetical protein
VNEIIVQPTPSFGLLKILLASKINRYQSYSYCSQHVRIIFRICSFPVRCPIGFFFYFYFPTVYDFIFIPLSVAKRHVQKIVTGFRPFEPVSKRCATFIVLEFSSATPTPKPGGWRDNDLRALIVYNEHFVIRLYRVICEYCYVTHRGYHYVQYL